MAVENIQSAIWHVPHTRRYRLTHIAGNWGEKWLVRREFLDQGEKTIESRNGISGHQHAPILRSTKTGSQRKTPETSGSAPCNGAATGRSSSNRITLAYLVPAENCVEIRKT
jgi:hypothetical protein